MQTVRTVEDLKARMSRYRAAGQRIALVPTMGALHAGHIALVDAARARADRVVVSIFVNPTQFAPDEDLARYPRREAADAKLLKAAGCDLLWVPDVTEIYPDGPVATIAADPMLSAPFEGATRPGHFDGVATVVSRLFEQVEPDIAVFGEKDYQQLLVIRRMVAEHGMPVESIGVPTQRDDDGLALSSRNAYLAEEDRAAARALPRALGEAKAAIEKGEAVAAALALAERRMLDAGFASVDYLALVDADTLQPVDRMDGEARLIAAARIGGTRLLDNLPVIAPTDD